MSDKVVRKIIEEYSQVHKQYNKVLFGLDVSAKNIEQSLLSQFSVQEITIEQIIEDKKFLQDTLDIHTKLSNLKSVGIFGKKI